MKTPYHLFQPFLLLVFLTRTAECQRTLAVDQTYSSGFKPCHLTNNLSLKHDCNSSNSMNSEQSTKLTNTPINSGYCPKSSTSSRHKILACFSTLVLITGILGNTLTIFVIQMSHELRKRVAYTLVKSLAVADLGVSIFVTSMKVDKYLNNGSFCHGFAICTLNHFTDSLFPITSITQLALIGIDRWMAIARPYKYVNFVVSRSKGYRAIISLWIYALIWTALGSITWQPPYTLAYKIQSVGRQRYCYSLNKYYHTTLDCFIYILPVVFTTALYLDVLRITWKKECRFNKPLRGKRKWRQYAEIKATRTVAAVFFAYTLCWFPHFIIVIFYYWMPNVITDFYLRDPKLYDVVTTVVSDILPTINSCVNPFIYFLVGRQFRVTLKDLYCKLLGRSRPSAIAMIYSSTSNDLNGIEMLRCLRKRILKPSKQSANCKGKLMWTTKFVGKM